MPFMQKCGNSFCRCDANASGMCKWMKCSLSALGTLESIAHRSGRWRALAQCQNRCAAGRESRDQSKAQSIFSQAALLSDRVVPNWEAPALTSLRCKHLSKAKMLTWIARVQRALSFGAVESSGVGTDRFVVLAWYYDVIWLLLTLVVDHHAEQTRRDVSIQQHQR